MTSSPEADAIQGGQPLYVRRKPLLFSGAITNFAQLALIGLMIIQIMTGVALIRLPGQLPQAFAQSAFKLSRHNLIFVGLAYITCSVIFLVILATEKTDLLLIGLAYLLAGVIYRLIRTRMGALSSR